MTVSICCLTYNHEKYIRQCLDGLIMQKTEFDFEILVHDDASSDATQSIINEYVVAYPNLIKFFRFETSILKVFLRYVKYYFL